MLRATMSSLKGLIRPVVKVAKELGVKAYEAGVKGLKSVGAAVKKAVKNMDPLATLIRMLG